MSGRRSLATTSEITEVPTEKSKASGNEGLQQFELETDTNRSFVTLAVLKTFNSNTRLQQLWSVQKFQVSIHIQTGGEVQELQSFKM